MARKPITAPSPKKLPGGSPVIQDAHLHALCHSKCMGRGCHGQEVLSMVILGQFCLFLAHFRPCGLAAWAILSGKMVTHNSLLGVRGPKFVRSYVLYVGTYHTGLEAHPGALNFGPPAVAGCLPFYGACCCWKWEPTPDLTRVL